MTRGLACFLTMVLATCFLATVEAQNIGNYWEYCNFYNTYATNDGKKSITSVWLHNGNLVEEGFGHIIIERGENTSDTIPFLYHAGAMIFHEKDYSKVMPTEQPEPTKMDSGWVKLKEFSDEMVTVNLSCIMRPYDKENSIRHYEGKFPYEWIIPMEFDALHSVVFRITELRNGDYVISLGTYGYYRSYAVQKGLRTIKGEPSHEKKLLRKHRSIYGNK